MATIAAADKIKAVSLVSTTSAGEADVSAGLYVTSCPISMSSSPFMLNSLKNTSKTKVFTSESITIETGNKKLEPIALSDYHSHLVGKNSS